MAGALFSYWLLGIFRRRTPTIKILSVPWTHFLKDVGSGDVVHAVVDSQSIRYMTKSGGKQQVHVALRLALPTGIMSKLKDSGAVVSAAVPSRSVLQIMVTLLPIIYIAAMAGVLYKFYNDSIGSVGGQAAKRRTESNSNVVERHSFDMVAGADDAKAAVAEVVDLLQDPTKYTRMGARVPRGLLLVGPPGTGKTLLAKCMAAEAGVPFFYCSGSEFVEVFAGRGASRVRNLFKRARKVAPSIVFIDELDAIGKRRSEGFSSNEERDQTLNELLTAMDGFDENEGKRVVVIGATNRFNVMDPALCRPGRFDRIVRVDLPDEAGRCAILRVHLRAKPCEQDLDVESIGRLADGFSGAELAGLVNEAAISAVRESSKALGTRHLRAALDNFMFSRQRSSGGSSSSESGIREFLERLGMRGNGRNFDN